MKPSRIPLIRQWSISLVIALMTGLLYAIVSAEDQPLTQVDTIAERAQEAWIDGATNRALDIINHGIQGHPQALGLMKIRGDILSTTRRPQEAVQAYETVLRETPDALDVRWVKWSVLLRSGKGDQAVAELQRIAQHDVANPLVPLRVAQELRKLDRLEESVGWFQKAVDLAPDLPGWRLALARSRFDILDGRGARDEVNHVLTIVSPGSPEEAAARSLLAIVYGATKERGRRYQPIFSPEGTSAERKEWASLRAQAWTMFEANRFKEAETVYRKILALKPNDFRATHEFGMTLMKLGECKEAITVFQKMSSLSPSDLMYADTFFRLGQCMVKLERWSEALIYFQLLYDAALNFEQSTADQTIVPGTKMLSKEKLEEWIDQVQTHVPGTSMPKIDTLESIPLVKPSNEASTSVEEMAQKLLKPSDPIYTRASLMGRDADFSLFRFIIPANRVMRDDLQGGNHEYIPIDPGDTFSTDQQEIYLVFDLVTASFDEVPLTAECFLETAKITREETGLTRDRVVMAMNDQSGYFMLSPPKTGWKPGLHRCGLFVGGEVSSYTHSDEVRFQIVEATPPL